MGICVGMDDENTHAEEYLAYMEAELEKEAREKEYARRNAEIIWNDFLKRLEEIENKKADKKGEV